MRGCKDTVTGWGIKDYLVKTSDSADESVVPKAIQELDQGVKHITG